MIQLTAIPARPQILDDNFLVYGNGLEILHAQISRDGVFAMKPAGFTHNFIQQHRDDSAVKKSRASLVLFTELKTANDPLRGSSCSKASFMPRTFARHTRSRHFPV